MTNNINGIDVSECMFYSDNNCDIGYIADSYPKNCKNNPNCYFKQLKHLQKENEELKEKIKDLDAMTGVFSVRLANKYKQALEEIREIIYKCEYDDISCVQCNERKRCHCDLTRLLIEKIDEVLKNE